MTRDNALIWTLAEMPDAQGRWAAHSLSGEVVMGFQSEDHAAEWVSRHLVALQTARLSLLVQARAGAVQ